MDHNTGKKHSDMTPPSSQPYSKTDHIMQTLRQREKELKRSRGEISCAECRRLKLRCDKKLPCSSCVRRGCQSICPNGVLSSGQGTRFVLADTEELHLKLVDMSERIRELEDALQTSHSNNSAGPHPLLRNDLKAIKYVVGHNVTSEDDIPRHPHDPLDSFGALKVSDDGETRFLGPSAGSEGILLTEITSGTHEGQEEEEDHPQVPPQLYELARMWPFTPINLPKDDVRVIIEAQLPTWERASVLYESYLKNIGWYNMPVNREQIVDELLPSVYKRSIGTSIPAENTETMLPKTDIHDLGLLLMVFACGAAGDRSREPKNDEGQLYYHLARVALGLQPVFESASLSTVQALTLMAIYDVAAIRKNNLEESWKMIFLAASIAGSIGLHRDPGRWKLDPKIMERRRKVFWEMYLVCNWQCLAGGRPPAFVRSSVDVQLPQDPDAITSTEGKTFPSYKMWKLRFLDECIAPVTDRLCADSTPLKYYETLHFDKKIREFGDIEIRDMGDASDNDEDVVSLSQKNRMLYYKSLLRLYLHRNFFGKSITEYPDNPLQPPFGMSFVTIFNNATSVLDELYQIRMNISGWIIRFWPVVAHALECGFVVGSVATRCPRTSYAITAFKSLEIAIELFHCFKHPVTKNGLPVLLRLQEKARQANYASHTVPSNSLPSSSSASAREEEALDELGILRGSSRLVAHSSDKRSLSTKPSSPPVPVDSSAFSGTVPQPETSPNLFFSEPGVQAQPQYPITAIDQGQMHHVSFPTTSTFNWSNLFNQPDEQLVLSSDFAMSIGVDDQTFAPGVFPNASESLQSWNFEGHPFQF